jgi:hypothetical protein
MSASICSFVVAGLVTLLGGSLSSLLRRHGERGHLEDARSVTP